MVSVVSFVVADQVSHAYPVLIARRAYSSVLRMLIGLPERWIVTECGCFSACRASASGIVIRAAKSGMQLHLGSILPLPRAVSRKDRIAMEDVFRRRVQKLSYLC